MDESRVTWRRSNRSHVGGNDCVEVAATWRKSSRSLGNNEQCVEVASVYETVLIRDSKDVGGPRHTMTPAAFRELVSRIKSGGLDL